MNVTIVDIDGPALTTLRRTLADLTDQLASDLVWNVAVAIDNIDFGFKVKVNDGVWSPPMGRIRRAQQRRRVVTDLDLRLPPHLAGLRHGQPVYARVETARPGDLILDDAGGHAGGWWGLVDSVADYRKGVQHRLNPADPHDPVILHDADLVRVTVHAEFEHGPARGEPGRIRVHTYPPAQRVTLRKLLPAGVS